MLIIDDDDVELTSLIKQFLVMNGYEVEHHGEKAILSILMHKPDLIVLDLMLPGVDGLTICSK